MKSKQQKREALQEEGATEEDGQPVMNADGQGNHRGRRNNYRWGGIEREL